MGKFLVNMGYRWAMNFDGVDGYIFNASGFSKEQANRRPFECFDHQWILFDPQLYLTNLDGATCNKTCAKLSTYPWFGINVPDFDSQEMNHTEWMDHLKASLSWNPSLPNTAADISSIVNDCLLFQAEFGVTHMIAPTPLVQDPDDQFSVQLQWLSAAAELKNHYNIPIFATVAISDYLLFPHRPANNLLLGTIIDNLTVNDFDGIYLLVVQEAADTLRLIDRNIVESLFYISYIAGKMHSKQIIINFADDLGFACNAIGATAFASGATVKQRRMSLVDFIDRGGGSAYPRLYSHSLIGDFLSEDDLTKIRNARLLRLINRDWTEEADSLLKALVAGETANSVPVWRQSNNNVTQANTHRIVLLKKKITDLNSLSTDNQLEAILTWLQDAEAHTALINNKLSGCPLKEDSRHIKVWREAFENMLDVSIFE